MAWPLHHYWVHSDETCTNQARYIVIGATVGTPETMLRFVRELEALPDNVRPGAMKWQKLKNAKLHRYRAAVDLFFRYNRRRAIDFHAIVIDTQRINHRKYNQGDGEIGFGKFLYQLYLTMKWKYGSLSTFHCFPDFRDTNYDLYELKRALNSSLSGFRKGRWHDDRSFREIEWWKDEGTSRLAQINDVLTGATGFLVNGRRSTGKDKSKETLADHVLRECPHSTFAKNSEWCEWHFRLWHFQLGE